MVKVRFRALPIDASTKLLPGGTYKYADDSGVLIVTSDGKYVVIIEPSGKIRIETAYPTTIAVPAEVEIRTT